MDVAYCNGKNGDILCKKRKQRVAENRNKDSGRQRDRPSAQRNQPCSTAQTAIISGTKVLTGEHRHC